MTREEARQAAEVMLAYAEGKEIQFMVRSGGQGWKDFTEGEAPKFSFNAFNYRIKPESIYRPFKNKEECWVEMQKHPDAGYLRIGSNRIIRFSISSEGIYSDKFHTYDDALYRYKFTDGTPFGIK